MINQLIKIPKGYLISIDSDGEWTSMIMHKDAEPVQHASEDKDDAMCMASDGHRTPMAAVRAVLKKWRKYK